MKRDIKIIERGQVFYRGRINKDGKKFKDEDLFAPPKEKAISGRLNPKGIPYLYVAYDEETVIYELRPWIGATITLAKCIPKKDLKVVSFVVNHQNEKQKENSFRRVLSSEFSKPVNPHLAEIEYLPTQSIAEYIREKGLDGIEFESSLHESGINIALFDTECMDIKFYKEVKVTSIYYRYSG